VRRVWTPIFYLWTLSLQNKTASLNLILLKVLYREKKYQWVVYFFIA
jgi:hypothetical protein